MRNAKPTVESLPIRDELNCLIVDGTLHALSPAWQSNRAWCKLSYEEIFRGLLGHKDKGPEYLCAFNILCLKNTQTGNTWNFLESDDQKVTRSGFFGVIDLVATCDAIPGLTVRQRIVTHPAKNAIVIEVSLVNNGRKDLSLEVSNLMEFAAGNRVRECKQRDGAALVTVYADFVCEYNSVALVSSADKTSFGSANALAGVFEGDPSYNSTEGDTCYAGLRGQTVAVKAGARTNLKYAIGLHRKGPARAVRAAEQALAVSSKDTVRYWNKRIGQYPKPPRKLNEQQKRAWWYSQFTLDINRYDLPNPKWVQASLFFFRSMWLWDMALGVRGSVQEKWAQDAVTVMLEAQTFEGRVPIWIAGGGATQPPIIARTAWEIYEARKDKKWLRSIFTRMLMYNNWTRQARLNEVGLYATGGGGEGGMDNSPVFDKDLRDYEGQRVANVHMSSCYYGYLVHLAKIAEELDDAFIAETLRKQAADLKDAMNRYFWNERDGWFYATVHDKEDPTKSRQIEIKSSDAFAAVWEDVASQEQVAKMHEVLKREFTTKHGVTCVSRREERYDQGNYWRGPMWMVIVMVLAEGLHKHGFSKTAKDIYTKITRILDRYGSTPEVIDAETGLPAFAERTHAEPCARFLTFHAGMYVKLSKLFLG